MMEMLNIRELSHDELKYICGHIPPSETRRLFQKYPKKFNKIKPGFRAEKLSDAETISVLVNNSKTDFVYPFIDFYVKQWLSEIKANLDSLEDAGYSAGEALLKTIPDSVFCDNCELYFKITQQDVDEQYLKLFRDALSFVQKAIEEADASLAKENEAEPASLLEEANGTIITLEKEIEQLQSERVELQESVHALKEQVKAHIDTAEDSSKKLQETEDTLAELRAELEHYKHLDNYADEEIEQDTDSQFQYISIGQISHDYSGQPWVIRLADINDGEIEPFIALEGIPHYFENRDRLYWRNGPSEDGSIGVWNWKAEPRDTDPSKDFITSEFSRNIRITEVVEFPQCKTLKDVANQITQWFERQFISNKVLFICTTANGTVEGLLCSPGNLEYSGTRARLVKSIYTLPHYTVRPSDIVKLADFRVFRKLNLGIPQSVYRVRTPYEVIKEMLLSRATIGSLREEGWQKKEAQKFRSYLESIPNQTLAQELSDAYACTEEEAQQYVQEFMLFVDSYLSDSDLDTKIISIALERNPALVERCKGLLTDAWEEENTKKIAEAQSRLDAAEKKTEEKKRETEKLDETRSEMISELEQLQCQINECKQLASDVEKKVSERIEDAKRCAADFISQMAFVSPTFVSADQTEKREKNPINIIRSCMEHVDNGEVEDVDTFEEELTENLSIIGYDEKVAIEMAQIISFCIWNNTPVIVGENAAMIAQCVAATLDGGDLAEIYVSNGDISVEAILSATQHDMLERQVILIHGLLDGYTMSAYNTLINQLRLYRSELIVLLSTEGIPANMIPVGVWANSLYIDGDEGLQNIVSGPVNSFKVSIVFERPKAENVRSKKKDLSAFSSVLCNTQMLLYASYLAAYKLQVEQSNAILNQMIVTARSSGKEELLNTVFHDLGIANGEEKLSSFK